jgi:hypothetical protein
MAVGLPCATKLRLLLSYDEETGILRWRSRVNQGVHAGDIAAGRINKGHRYLRIKIKGQQYGAHRLIWKIKTGNEPPDCIDHIDGHPFNNRWQNLREASISLNGCNRKMQKNNSSGTKGVTWNKADKRWKAVICIDRKPIYLGYFKDKEAAIVAVNAARPQFHGEFARYI